MLLMCAFCALAFFFLRRQNIFLSLALSIECFEQNLDFFSNQAGFVSLIRIMQLLSAKSSWQSPAIPKSTLNENKSRESATRVLSICCRPGRKPHNTVPKFNDVEAPFQWSIVSKAMASASSCVNCDVCAGQCGEDCCDRLQRATFLYH